MWRKGARPSLRRKTLASLAALSIEIPTVPYARRPRFIYLRGEAGFRNYRLLLCVSYAFRIVGGCAQLDPILKGNPSKGLVFV